MKWLKSIYKKVYIVYDSRGASAEKHHLKTKVTPEKEILYQKTLNQQIKQSCLADRILCVSSKLKEYHLQKDKTLSENKLIIIPGCADKNKFYFDNKLRNTIRKELRIEDEIVFLYSGALDKEWQIPDFVFSAFSLLCNIHENSFFILLTPNLKIVSEFAKKYNINEKRIFAKFASFNEINSFLNAADAGILFREDAVTNNVASPTKYAEYLLAGLPVIISEKIGDFSEFTNENNLGIVTKNDLNELRGKLGETNFLKYDRALISEIGKKNYSKQSYLAKLIEVYKNS